MKNQLPDAACRTPVFAAPQNAAEQPKTTAENAALPQSAPVPDAPPSAPVPGGSRTAGGLALLFSAVLGYLYVRLLLFTGTVGASLFWPGPLAFTLLFAAAVGVWARQSAPQLGGEGLLWLGCALTAAAALTFVRLNAVPQGLAVLFWHGAALYGVLACTGQLTEGRTGPFCAADLLRGVGMGFAGLAAWPRDLLRWLCSRPAKGGRPRRSAAPAVGCVAVSAALLCLAASWLGRADAGFAALLQSIAFWNNGFWQGKWLGQTVFCLAVGLPVGAFFYGLAVTGSGRLASRPRPALQRRAEQLARLRCVSERLLCGVLGAFAGLYLLFFLVQGQYLFGGLVGRLPQGFTLSGYARQGFFELCAVMLLNFAVLAGAGLLARQPLTVCRPLCCAAAVLLLESLLLWLTAAAKLWLYVAAFGFTARRLLAAWALLVLAVAAVRALMYLRTPCTVVRPTVLTGAVALALLCLY